MSLVPVVDTLATRLQELLGPGVRVADAQPGGANELPAVAVSVVDAAQRLEGVGRIPRGPRKGALEVEDRIDLTDPVLRIGDEEIDLLEEERRAVVLAHGPLVQADGSPPPPLTGDDVTVVQAGDALTVVDGEPQPGEVRADPDLGRLVLGSPAPDSGAIVVGYHIGVWEVEAIRFTGTCALDVYAGDAAATGALSREVAEALDTPPEAFPRLRPVSWGVALLEDPAQGPARRAQRLTYAFDFDLEIPSLPTGGGVIRRVAVTSRPGVPPETFDVPTLSDAP